MTVLEGFGTTAYGTGIGVTTTPVETCLSVDYLIERTFDLLLGAAREERNQLASSIDAGSPTFTVTWPLGALKRGTYLAIDDEVMYVWDTNSGSGNTSTVTAQRGDKGTTATPHASGSLIQVNPYFTKYVVRKTLQDEIRSWGPQVFQVQTVDIPAVNFIRGYDLGILTEFFYILNVQESPDVLTQSSPDNLWRTVSHHVDHSAEPTVFPSGAAIYITEPLGVFDTPRTFRVTYSAPLDVDTTFDDDDCLHVMGIDDSDVDIAPYGAAWRLAASREVKRMLTEAQGSNADLQNFPPGYQLKAAEQFKQLRDSRLQDAIQRLRSKYPIRKVS